MWLIQLPWVFLAAPQYPPFSTDTFLKSAATRIETENVDEISQHWKLTTSVLVVGQFKSKIYYSWWFVWPLYNRTHGNVKMKLEFCSQNSQKMCFSFKKECFVWNYKSVFFLPIVFVPTSSSPQSLIRFYYLVNIYNVVGFLFSIFNCLFSIYYFLLPGKYLQCGRFSIFYFLLPGKYLKCGRFSIFYLLFSITW